MGAIVFFFFCICVLYLELSFHRVCLGTRHLAEMQEVKWADH